MNIYSTLPKVILLVLMTAMSSCSGSQNRDGKKENQGQIPLETYIKINRSLVEREQKKIEQYVKEHNLEMETTGTGLWYGIEAEGEGDKVKKGQVVTLDYEIKLLDGTVCYSSDESGPKEFLVGQGGVESGLEEGVLLLKPGAKARFIMPPHLAHGLIGDDDQIPSRAIILYEVTVLDVKNN
ncbi:FKBP-type peptidyl-prolyl cis-trans isomerase [Marinilabilia rubra]|uniref:Peptidyl-prolyl cis-trans isomerase n=1 Tax=Marinilabilia rubra TaxID=2162893 RepID=A0A2U2B5J4_9BACT|nr:FKBP-type peptidyl-prolyl cis-trans isomerase [Marinilabilia rubra]PWD98326.1 peptidylprolyl isomerase [Marinilabilia rubra]